MYNSTMRYSTLKEEKKLWKNGYQLVAGIDEVGRGCERPDSEVLTNNGWKFYADINPETDKVLSYGDDGYIRWQNIERIIEKSFRGNLIELKNKGVDIVVTPDHYFPVLRRVFQRDKKDNNRLKLIAYKARSERRVVTSLLSNDFIPRGGMWRGVHKKFFTLARVNPLKNPVSNSINRNTKQLVHIRYWVAFLGIFLAEGSTSYDKKSGSYKVVISQSNSASPRKYRRIAALLKNLPFRFHKFPTGFICHSKQLYTYLEQFGKSYQKFIPKEIKELPPRLLNILVDWMIVGDGTCYTGKNRKRVCVYYTVSRKLKDDFEEILLKAGWTYHTTVRTRRDRMINSRIIRKENQKPCFEIRLRRNMKIQVKSLYKKEIFYKGKVFCLQLSRHHNFYVRRNGSGYFTGNSLAGPVVACAVAVLPWSGQGNPWPDQGVRLRLRDSKQLSQKQREELYTVLVNHPSIAWGVGKVFPGVIDRINIFQATKLAMKRAVMQLEKKLEQQLHFLILDGNMKLDIETPQTSMVKADEKVFSCAAASIIAKVKRDRLMARYHKQYGFYGFDRHKGYGTKFHVAALREHGPCDIHRKSFAPVLA